MDFEPSCPVCGGSSWERIGKRSYDKKEISHLSEYAKIRYEVLFNLWLPELSAIELQSLLCAKCGFVIYSPRPSEADIDRKYAYLATHAVAGDEYAVGRQSDRKRSAALYRTVRSYLPDRASVLDFGGGNGRLMSAFVERGHACDVVDYTRDTVPGVTPVGPSLTDIPAGKRYDLVVCSHVLEHLAEPAKLIRELSSFTKPDGILYVEVPSEIWRAAPFANEPVTHINFFVSGSLRTLLQTAGLDVPTCRNETYVTYDGGVAMAIKAIARLPRQDSSPRVSFSGVGEAKRMLHAGFPGVLVRLFRHPRLIPGFVRTLARRARRAGSPTIARPAG